MARILFANQWGAGRGHVTGLAKLADAALIAGHEPVFVVPDLVEARPVVQASLSGRSGCKVFQAPLGRNVPLESGEAKSFVDYMASNGFGDPAVLLPQARAWSRLLDLVRPDLVVLDHSPTLALATRGRVRTIASSFASGIPPKAAFGNRADGAPDDTAANKELVLRTANECLDALGRPRLGALGDLLPERLSFPIGMPEFDMFADDRVGRPSRAWPPPPGAPLSAAPPIVGLPSVFAYISTRKPKACDLLIRLAGSGVAVTASVRDYFPAAVSEMRAAGVVVNDANQPLAELLVDRHLYLHHGGMHSSEDGLALGRPQICLHFDAEKKSNSDTLELLGVGKGIAENKAADLTVDAVLDFAADPERQQRAASLATDVAQRAGADLGEAFVAFVEEVLGA